MEDSGLVVQGITLWLLVPLGLSYRVLEMIAYLVDVQRDSVEPVSDFGDFTLYLAYFPKLVAGPIERVRTFMPKLAEPRVVDGEQMTRSLTRNRHRAAAQAGDCRPSDASDPG